MRENEKRSRQKYPLTLYKLIRHGYLFSLKCLIIIEMRMRNKQINNNALLIIAILDTSCYVIIWTTISYQIIEQDLISNSQQNGIHLSTNFFSI